MAKWEQQIKDYISLLEKVEELGETGLQFNVPGDRYAAGRRHMVVQNQVQERRCCSLSLFGGKEHPYAVRERADFSRTPGNSDFCYFPRLIPDFSLIFSQFAMRKDFQPGFFTAEAQRTPRKGRTKRVKRGK